MAGERPGVTEALQMNPTRAIKVYEEICNKEIRCYKKWQAAD